MGIVLSFCMRYYSATGEVETASFFEEDWTDLSKIQKHDEELMAGPSKKYSKKVLRKYKPTTDFESLRPVDTSNRRSVRPALKKIDQIRGIPDHADPARLTAAALRYLPESVSSTSHQTKEGGLNSKENQVGQMKLAPTKSAPEDKYRAQEPACQKNERLPSATVATQQHPSTDDASNASHQKKGGWLKLKKLRVAKKLRRSRRTTRDAGLTLGNPCEKDKPLHSSKVDRHQCCLPEHVVIEFAKEDGGESDSKNGRKVDKIHLKAQHPTGKETAQAVDAQTHSNSEVSKQRSLPEDISDGHKRDNGEDTLKKEHPDKSPLVGIHPASQKKMVVLPAEEPSQSNLSTGQATKSNDLNKTAYASELASKPKKKRLGKTKLAPIKLAPKSATGDLSKIEPTVKTVSPSLASLQCNFNEKKDLDKCPIVEVDPASQKISVLPAEEPFKSSLTAGQAMKPNGLDKPANASELASKLKKTRLGKIKLAPIKPSSKSAVGNMSNIELTLKGVASSQCSMKAKPSTTSEKVASENDRGESEKNQEDGAPKNKGEKKKRKLKRLRLKKKINKLKNKKKQSKQSDKPSRLQIKDAKELKYQQNKKVKPYKTGKVKRSSVSKRLKASLRRNVQNLGPQSLNGSITAPKAVDQSSSISDHSHKMFQGYTNNRGYVEVLSIEHEEEDIQEPWEFTSRAVEAQRGEMLQHRPSGEVTIRTSKLSNLKFWKKRKTRVMELAKTDCKSCWDEDGIKKDREKKRKWTKVKIVNIAAPAPRPSNIYQMKPRSVCSKTAKLHQSNNINPVQPKDECTSSELLRQTSKELCSASVYIEVPLKESEPVFRDMPINSHKMSNLNQEVGHTSKLSRFRFWKPRKTRVVELAKTDCKSCWDKDSIKREKKEKRKWSKVKIVNIAAQAPRPSNTYRQAQSNIRSRTSKMRKSSIINPAQPKEECTSNDLLQTIKVSCSTSGDIEGLSCKRDDNFQEVPKIRKPSDVYQKAPKACRPKDFYSRNNRKNITVLGENE